MHRVIGGVTSQRMGLVAFATVVLASAPGLSAQEPRHSFDLQVPEPPNPVTVSGETRLAYELHVTNLATTALRLERLEVFDPVDPERPLARFEGDELASLLVETGRRQADADPRVLEPGTRSVAYFWLGVDRVGGTPATLSHRLSYRASDEGSWSDEGRVTGGGTPVSAEAPPVLSPPLRGGPWTAVYYPLEARGHRRVLYALEGRVHIPARFAVDWIRIDERGRRAAEDPSRVAHWYGYGADVLAVADGLVVAVRDSIDEPEVLERVAHGLALASGNHLTLEIGDGRYVSYEHLRPGSIRVALGDRVTVGQTIAQVGYTGSSGGPHLHMHVSDGPAALAGEGVPFVIRSFEYLGSYGIRDLAREGPWTPADSGSERRSMELPGPNAVVRFPAGGGGGRP